MVDIMQAIRAGIARNQERPAQVGDPVAPRRDMPSLSRMLVTWNLTASMLIWRRSAIWRLVMPWRTAWATRHSPGVSTSGWAGRPRLRSAVMTMG